jgi:hypothetical protein
VGRTIEFTRLQSIGNFDSSLTEEFVFLLLFGEHRYRKCSIALRRILRDGKAKLRIPDRVLAALGVHRSLFSSTAEREFDVGILLVKSVVVNKMLSFEDDNDEGAQFLRHCGLGRKWWRKVVTGGEYKTSNFPKQGKKTPLNGRCNRNTVR